MEKVTDLLKEISESILQGIGGKENVVSAAHCATRLRLVLKDDKKADVGCSVKICDDYIYNAAGAVYVSVLPEVFCKGCHARLVKRVTV